MKKPVVVLLVVLLGLSACSKAEPVPQPSRGIRSTASVVITSPKIGAVFDASSVPVKVKLIGGKIAAKASNNPADIKPDVGHVHIVVDDVTVSLLAGLTFDIVQELKKENLPPLAPGKHLLRVDFANVAHGFFDPPVSATTTFSVT